MKKRKKMLSGRAVELTEDRRSSLTRPVPIGQNVLLANIKQKQHKTKTITTIR